ncbi:uncharacterized protein CBL_04589 [Carabus blaptoides fortunei]
MCNFTGRTHFDYNCIWLDVFASGIPRYFWHITDIHYDSMFSVNGDIRKGCGRFEYDGGSGARGNRRPSGRYGDYSCDAPWDLIESAATAMQLRQGDNIEFVLWTGFRIYNLRECSGYRENADVATDMGPLLHDWNPPSPNSLPPKRADDKSIYRDALSHTAKRLPESRQLELLGNVTDLLKRTFSSQFVFPALGHDDPSMRQQLGELWNRWVPPDSMHNFEREMPDHFPWRHVVRERKCASEQSGLSNSQLSARKPCFYCVMVWSDLSVKLRSVWTSNNTSNLSVTESEPRNRDARTPTSIVNCDLSSNYTHLGAHV